MRDHGLKDRRPRAGHHGKPAPVFLRPQPNCSSKFTGVIRRIFDASSQNGAQCLKDLVRPRGVTVSKLFNNLACPTAPTSAIENISVFSAMSNHLRSLRGEFLTAICSAEYRKGSLRPLGASLRALESAQANRELDHGDPLPSAKASGPFAGGGPSICRGA